MAALTYVAMLLVTRLNYGVGLLYISFDGLDSERF